MKLRHLLFGLLAGVAFVACTNDDDPASVSPVNGGNEVAATRSYISVNFVMPGNATTRAWDGNLSTGYVPGEGAENAVTKVLFFFMKGQAQVADPYEISADNAGNLNALEGTKLNPWADGDEKTIEKLSNIVVVLANKVENPTEIIAVLNAGLSDLKLSKTSTLGDIQAVVGKYAEQANAENNPNFVMSSSIYDEVREKVGAHVDEQKVYETLEEAKAKPSVRIPVERVVAKVVVKEKEDGGATQNTGNSSDATKPSTTVSLDGEDATITAEITGWWLDNNPSQSLLIKKLDASYTVDGTALDKNWYDDATNYRSYWATPNTGDLNHYAYTTKANVARYTLENTDQAHPTQVVVAATLKGADNKPLDLVKYMGELYTKDGFDTALINVLAHKYWVVDKEKSTDTKVEYKTVSAADVALTYNDKAGEQYEAEVTIAKKAVGEGETPADWYIKGTGETYSVADPSADFTALKRTVQFWNGGKTYYSVKIVQNDGITVGTGDAAHKLYGVIRNHLYQITAKSINGLGTPVPFSDTDTTPIIPVIPEDDRSYISAEIAILKYKLVKQDVDLGK
jgi:hypothetical protein